MTGFGLFNTYKVNASWEAVKLLNDRKFPGYKLITVEVPVTYKYIEENIDLLWSKYKPSLVIHVGVCHRRWITLEHCANRLGYVKTDSEDCCHPTQKVCEIGEDCIRTGINIEAICASLEKHDIKIGVSKDAGRYLCEYIYYKSLNIDSSKTLFVHVPSLNEPYTAEQLSESLHKIIMEALKQVNS